MSWSAVRVVMLGDGEGAGADTVGVGSGEDPVRFGTSRTAGAPAPMTTRTPVDRYPVGRWRRRLVRSMAPHC